MGTLLNEPVQLLLFSASMIAHFGRTKKLSTHVFHTPSSTAPNVRNEKASIAEERESVHYIFLAIAFTCVGLLTISFSQYIIPFWRSHLSYSQLYCKQ